MRAVIKCLTSGVNILIFFLLYLLGVFLISLKRLDNAELFYGNLTEYIERKKKTGLIYSLFVWVLWYINLCRLFNTKSIFIQMNSSISNNSVWCTNSFNI